MQWDCGRTSCGERVRRAAGPLPIESKEKRYEHKRRKIPRGRVLGRSNNNANANAGVAYSNTNNASTNSNTNNGARLC